ncbi:carboxypeptidase S [Cylindrobasidium torrendii FP15055 ss-10]|uniref:Carboxypeptidase S n=1 Tax=Cylindrobasidium torrendii FP15055 ss-10 TaxID=1314674 RepID=A0A0D7BAX0_9AGAR|nr:carboxypeptidase S [Cylindrobasidium torrendii FP15055 ss-10]
MNEQDDEERPICVVLGEEMMLQAKDKVPRLDIMATAPACPQVASLYPSLHASLDAELNALYASTLFKLEAYERLGKAVEIPTESYDDFDPVGQDPRWGVFASFHTYIEESFPLVHRSMQVTKINTYALVFHWQGSNPELKPLLIAAHQDVVPVDPTTVEQWTHPPYSGHYDGTWIWGRGSADDKADLVAQLITAESLLKAGFTPRRTIVFAFGIDEEAAGTQGAGALAVYLEEKYGTDAFTMLIDEGEGHGSNAVAEPIFALPGISEKGYLDVRMQVSAPGGHSSVPPDHTSIGLLSLLVVALEQNAHPAVLRREGTGFANMQCRVQYDRKRYPEALRELARRALTDDAALEEFKHALIRFDKSFGVLLKTTQAVDLINGGVKINALPEVAAAVVNHRIAEHSSVEDVQSHITALALPIAKEFNLSVNAFGTKFEFGTEGHVVLEDAFYSALEPSPVSPIDPSGPYGVLSGTIKSTLESSARYKASEVIVIPSLGLGNTDTRFYWNLTRHIFRYSHRGDLDDLYNGLHTVDEAVRGESIIEQIRFFTKLILNVDEML